MFMTNATYPPNEKLNPKNTRWKSRPMSLPKNLRQMSLLEKVPILLAICKIKMLPTNYKMVSNIKSITSKTLIKTNFLLVTKKLNYIGTITKQQMIISSKEVQKNKLKMQRICGMICKLKLVKLHKMVQSIKVILKIKNENEIKKFMLN